MPSIEQLRLFAQLAEQTERYEDMTKYTKQIIQKSIQITENDRKLFSTAYKCKIGERRTAWRAISASLCKQTLAANKPIINWYKQNLQLEIRQICAEVIEIISPFLSAKSQKNIEKQKEKQEIRNKLEFFKMKGDYLRYLCEIVKESEQKSMKQECQKSYRQAMKLMESATIKDSLKTDSLKLAICLNFSVFHYQINNSLPQAIEICEKGFNQALEAVTDLEDNRFTDVVTIMQLMHDNITSWKIQLEKESK